jgi:hypothetical protein
MRSVADIVEAELAAPAPPAAQAFAALLTQRFDAPAAVLFYGSILRTGDLDGVMDFYVLTHRPPRALRGLASRLLWPDVGYYEIEHEGVTLRAKVASMTLAQFQGAVTGEGADTTVWTRFVQPSALLWSDSAATAQAVTAAIAQAARTASRFAAALGPPEGAPAASYWTALFKETYAAEFRVERGGREQSILAFDPARWDALLRAAWRESGLMGADDGATVSPHLALDQRRRITGIWRRRRALGKPLNVARLIKAAFTFEGAARYGAWKIERHTGMAVPLTAWRERHPILAAPGVLWRLRKLRRRT